MVYVSNESKSVLTRAPGNCRDNCRIFTKDVAAAKKAGMNAHLAKPLDIGKMLAVIARYLNK